MRETRRTLQAENTQLRSQLAVHNHATRQSLHEYIRAVEARNKDLVETIKKQAAQIESMRSKQEAESVAV